MSVWADNYGKAQFSQGSRWDADAMSAEKQSSDGGSDSPIRSQDDVSVLKTLLSLSEAVRNLQERVTQLESLTEETERPEPSRYLSGKGA